MDYERIANLIFPDVSDDISYFESLYPERTCKFVTRFAPSPTGFLHIGSLYTAYIASVFAHQNDGIMMLRIEDTDSKREVLDARQNIISDLSNFGIDIDEGINSGNYGPYIQSQRCNIYHTYAKYLIKIGKAYPCFMTEEELDEIRKYQEQKKIRIGIYGKYAKYRNISFDEIKEKIDLGSPFVIRFKSNGCFDDKIVVSDLIKGDIEFPSNDLDFVLLKSDLIPTYHFAHVIDDHLMRTTHVIRGEEWLSSLPIHYELFNTFGFKMVKYAHISPLTKKEGSTVRKLSKRKDVEAKVSYYDEIGIPSDVIKLYFNTLINSNYEEWYNNPYGEFKFNFKKMSVGGTLFDIDKMLNISKTYFSRMSASDLYKSACTYFYKYDKEFYDIFTSNESYSINMLNIERNLKKPRKDLSCYSDIKKYYWYFYDQLFYNNIDSFDKKYDVDLLRQYISVFNYNDDRDEWYSNLKKFAVQNGYSDSVKEYNLNPCNYKGHIGDVCEIIRVSLTSVLQSPDIYEIMHVYGYEKVISRFTYFVENC